VCSIRTCCSRAASLERHSCTAWRAWGVLAANSARCLGIEAPDGAHVAESEHRQVGRGGPARGGLRLRVVHRHLQGADEDSRRRIGAAEEHVPQVGAVAAIERVEERSLDQGPPVRLEARSFSLSWGAHSDPLRGGTFVIDVAPKGPLAMLPVARTENPEKFNYFSPFRTARVDV
jgi:hypothetical protein